MYLAAIPLMVLMVMDASLTPLSSFSGEGEKNSNGLEESTLDCQLDSGHSGLCHELARCPVEEDEFLARFPIYCRLRNNRQGVCCHKKEVQKSSTIGESCTFNSTVPTGVCQDIGNCPSLDHLYDIKDYIFCDLTRAVVCCPDTDPQLPKEQREGDVCTLYNGEQGTCRDSLTCSNDPHKPFGSTNVTYCDKNSRVICCQSNKVPVSTARPQVSWKGDNCSLSNDQRGTCRDIMDCTRALNVISLSNAEYCYEPTLLVCCPLIMTQDFKPEVDTDVGVSSPNVNFDFKPEVDTDVGVSSPNVNFACGNSYPERVLRTDQPLASIHSDRYSLYYHAKNLYDERKLDFRDVLRTVSIKYMALVGIETGVNHITWICNGVLINERWILSAAHCFLIRGSDGRNSVWSSMVVRLGDYDYHDNSDLASFEDLRVEKVVSYPDYSLYEGYHDLALIKLRNTVTFGRYINPVCLPWGTGSRQDLEGYHVIQTGWGASWPSGVHLTFLHRVTLTVFPSWKCDRIYSDRPDYTNIFPTGIGKDTLCAGDPHADEIVCHGDSGGPLVYLNSNQQYVLAGVEFKSYGCHPPRDPGLFVNIQMVPYLSWIKAVAFLSTSSAMP